jgi:hypothetical protein
VIKDNDLKLREPKNDEVTVNFIGEKKDGSKQTVVINGRKRTKAATVSASSGTTGETKIFKSHHITDKKSLTLVANAKQEQFTYSGYEGKITAFLQPYAAPNMKAQIVDVKFPERSGVYLVVSTEVSYGMSGARRIVEIGKRVYE